MKQKLIHCCAGVLISIFSMGCSESEQQGVDVPFTEYSIAGESGEEVSARWVNLDYYKDFALFNGEYKILIINSDDEFKKYVEGDYSPIDFSKRTLVVAYEGRQDQYLFYSDKQYFRKTSKLDYVLTINIPPFLGAVVGSWRVAIIVDKLPSDSNIKVNLTKNNK